MKRKPQRVAILAGLIAWISMGCSARTPDNQFDQGAQARVVQCRAANGTWEMLEAGGVPSATDTVFAIEVPNNEADIATSAWIVARPSLIFQGERYFMGPNRMHPLHVYQRRSATGPATIVPVGTHDGVTVYTWRPIRSPMFGPLFLRSNTECGIQHYWHEEQVR